MKEVVSFLKTRRSTTAKTMLDGIVKKEDLENIINVGIRVPDHGALNPWKIIVIKDEVRNKLGIEVLDEEAFISRIEQQTNSDSSENKINETSGSLSGMMNNFYNLENLTGEAKLKLLLSKDCPNDILSLFEIGDLKIKAKLQYDQVPYSYYFNFGSQRFDNRSNPGY